MLKDWGRPVLALLVGVTGAAICVAALEMLGHRLVDGEAGFAAAVAALGAGALVGGAISVRIGHRGRLAWVVAVVLAAMALWNILSFRHPAWFMPVATLTIIAGAWIATRAAPRQEMS